MKTVKKNKMTDCRREAAEVRSKKQGAMRDDNFSLKKFLSSFLFLLFFIPALSFAQNIPDQPTGHVNDFADMLTQSEQQQLEQKLRNYRDTTTTVIAIATINSLEGRDIQQVGTELFNRWNIWEGDKNNGVLILISKQDRRMRIDVGYGLEGAIPDVMAGRIIREVLTPAFKKGNYYAGLDRATTILIDLARGEFQGQLTKRRSSDGDDLANLIVFLLFVAFVIYTSSRKGGGKNGGKRRRTMGPGGFIFLGSGFGGGGGSFGGGGGGFGGFSGGGGFGAGGGGASGGW